MKTAAMIALAAGSLFASACKKEEAKANAAEKTSKVHCMGVNECKGHGACKTAQNACAGQNGCQGQGFVEMTETECKDKGGSVMAAK